MNCKPRWPERRKMRAIRGLAFVICIVGLFAEDVFPEPETGYGIDDIVDIALERNQTLESLQLSEKSSRLSRLDYWTDYMPNLSLSYGYTRDGSKNLSLFADDRNTDVYGLSANMSWTLFAGGQRWLDLRRINAQLEGSRAELTEYEKELEYIVRSACYGVIYSRQALFIAGQTLERAEDERDFVSEKYELGLASKLDLTRMEIELANARLSMLQKENSLRSAYRSLNSILDLPADSVYGIKDDQDDLGDVPSLNEFMERAQKSPKWKQIETNWQQSVYAANMSFSSFFPTVTATAAYSFSSGDFPEDIQTFEDGSSTLGINLSWYLINGGKRVLSLEQAKISKETADLSYEMSARNYFNDIRDTYANLEEAQRSVELAEAQWESAKLSLELVEEEFRLGTASILDLLDTRLAYLESHNNMISAQQSMRTNYAKLLWLCPPD